MPKPPTKRSAHRPEHEPTKADRDTVMAMVAGGIEQKVIAGARGLSRHTLRKHYKNELINGTGKINGVVVAAHVKKILAGDFNAIKWWEQSRMGWSETQKIETTGPDGRPIEQVVTYKWAEPAK
jgi:hypothetical protein